MSQACPFSKWDLVSPKTGSFAGQLGIIECIKDGFGGHDKKIKIFFDNGSSYTADATAFDLIQSRPALEDLPEGLKSVTQSLQRRACEQTPSSQSPCSPQL